MKGRQGWPPRQREQLARWLRGAKELGTSQEAEKTSIVGQTERGGEWKEVQWDQGAGARPHKDMKVLLNSGRFIPHH